MSQHPLHLLIQGGTVVTCNPQGEVLENAYVEVKDGKIVAIGAADQAPTQGIDKVLDASGSIIMPGLINGHTHAGMGLLRGLVEDLPVERWLQEHIFPLERKWGSFEFVEFSSKVSLLEMIRTGTTTLNDMYYFQAATAKAVQESGMRALCGHTVVEISGIDIEKDLEAQFDRFLADVEPYSRVIPTLAPHSPYGVERRTLEQMIAYCQRKKIRAHIHLAESRTERGECQKRFGLTPVRYCEEVGLFEIGVTAAHVCTVDEGEIEILGKHQVGVVHNPESNMKLGNEISPVVELIEAGACVGLGTDGVASNNDLDLLSEVDFATKLQAFRGGTGHLSTRRAIQMLTLEGARALGLGNQIGSLEVGKEADVIVVDTRLPHATPLHDPRAHLVYSAKGLDVLHSVIAGRPVMEDRTPLTLNASDIMEEAREWGKKIRQSQ